MLRNQICLFVLMAVLTEPQLDTVVVEPELNMDVWATKPKPRKPRKVQLNRIERSLLYYTNLEREKRGLVPLKIDRKLQLSARKHCKWMMKTGNYRHSDQGFENIANGQWSAREVVYGWMRSKGHRENILDSEARTIGVAGYLRRGKTTVGRNFWMKTTGRAYWVQQFARPDKNLSSREIKTK